MIFATYWFIAFVAIVLPIYLLVPDWRVRYGFLLVSCVVFHGHFAGAAGVIPIIILGILTYLVALTRNKHLQTLGISINVLALCFYKYIAFFCNKIIALADPGLANALWTSVNSHLPAAPPLGISFFAFEFVHYLYEVRKDGPPIRNPLDFMQFAIFFPSLVAGPIKRYRNFLPSLYEGLKEANARNVIPGATRVLVGYFKKAVIADNLTIWINSDVPRFDVLTPGLRWGIFAGIALRIYLDFSGYSDMALGFANMLGIQIPENFNWPYVALNIQDFWHRWHISLSNWIRDYVYIPLGGSRGSHARKWLNGFVAFALCGLWHGADWNFVIWGLYHGFGLTALKVFQDEVKPRLKQVVLPENRYARTTMQWGWTGFSWSFTLMFVCIGWLAFFYPMPQALHMLALLFR